MHTRDPGRRVKLGQWGVCANVDGNSNSGTHNLPCFHTKSSCDSPSSHCHPCRVHLSSIRNDTPSRHTQTGLQVGSAQRRYAQSRGDCVRVEDYSTTGRVMPSVKTDEPVMGRLKLPMLVFHRHDVPTGTRTRGKGRAESAGHQGSRPTRPRRRDTCDASGWPVERCRRKCLGAGAVRTVVGCNIGFVAHIVDRPPSGQRSANKDMQSLPATTSELEGGCTATPSYPALLQRRPTPIGGGGGAGSGQRAARTDLCEDKGGWYALTLQDLGKMHACVSSILAFLRHRSASSGDRWWK